MTTEVKKDVLDAFWKLSNAKSNVRIDAATKIVAQISKVSVDKI